jgi:hypothetical protein
MRQSNRDLCNGRQVTQADAAPWFDEVMKKSAVVWIGVEHRTQAMAMWLAWVDGRVYLLTGGAEQPDPGLVPGAYATVTARSKENQHRVMTWVAETSVVTPADADWDDATGELVKRRLNLRESTTAVERWAAGAAVVWRLTPTGELVESPGHFRTDATFVEPIASPATTSGRRPAVIGPRGGRGAPLSDRP